MPELPIDKLPVHKLIQPVFYRGILGSLILCKDKDIYYRKRYATSINDVTCDECLRLWRHGRYA